MQRFSDPFKILELIAIALLTLGSRQLYDYLKTGIKPKKSMILAQIVLGSFVCVLVLFICIDFDVKSNRITWVVMVAGFLNHTLLTYLLENWKAILEKFKPKK